MATSENEALVKKWIEEGWNARNPALIDELFHPDFIVAGRPNRRMGLEGYKQYVHDLLTAFPDWHFEIRECISEGDFVIITYRVSGTHTGLGYGVRPPSGNRLETVVIDVWRVSEGKIRERTNAVFEEKDIARQLGFNPVYIPTED